MVVSLSAGRDTIELDVFFPCNLYKPLFDACPNTQSFGRVEIAELHGKLDAAGNDIDRARLDADVAHRPHLAPGFRANLFADCEHGASCTGQSVLAAIHWRGARMIGEPSGGAGPPVNADDALHHADLNVTLVEHAALFDMQLNVGSERAAGNARVGELRGVLSVTAQPVGHGLPIVVLAFQDVGRPCECLPDSGSVGWVSADAAGASNVRVAKTTTGHSKVARERGQNLFGSSLNGSSDSRRFATSTAANSNVKGSSERDTL